MPQSFGNKLLAVQSKLSLKDVDEFDTIMSKFRSFYNKYYHVEPDSILTLLGEVSEEADDSLPELSFMIATLSDLDRIIPAYEKSTRASKDFYYKMKSKGRLHRLDGPKILPITQAAYRKLHILPSDVEIRLSNTPLQRGNVYIGILSAIELKACYDKFGDALFLDNIRSFLGYSSGKKKTDANRDNVNEAISETAQFHPDQMLAKNNGITFRAKKVTSGEENVLRLDDASIVNGCQTTMCLVRSPNPEAFVLVKVVEVPESDSWNIAKAANFQNRVEEIQLVLARYIRPQLVKGFESKAGVHVVHDTSSIFDIFSSIYRDQVAYDEIYYLFIGLFSKNVNNMVSANYTELDDDLLKPLQEQALSEKTFHILFNLYKAAHEARASVEKKYKNETYKKIFQRFWKENKPNYRCMLTILAACGCVEINIYDRQASFNNFLQKIEEVLENETPKFIRYYHYAYEAIASYLLSSKKSENDILRTMYDELRTVRFENLYMQLRIFADGREP